MPPSSYRADYALSRSVSSREQLDELRLAEAVEHGDTAGMQYLLQRHHICPQPDLLFVACEHGHANIVSLLLDEGVSAEQRTTGASSTGRAGPTTPLLLAASLGHVNVVAMLTSKGQLRRGLPGRAPGTIDEGIGRAGTTPLLAACERGHEAVTMALLAAGADASRASSEGVTPLYEASARGHTAIVRRLLGARAFVDAARPVLPSLGAHGRSTPLFASCAAGHEEVASLLMGASADAHAQQLRGLSPAHAAVSNGHAHILRAILRAQPPPGSTTDGRGETLLVSAASAGQSPCVALLLEWHSPPPAEAGMLLPAAGTTSASSAASALAAGAMRRDVENAISRARSKLPSATHEDCLELLRRWLRARLGLLLHSTRRLAADAHAGSQMAMDAPRAKGLTTLGLASGASGDDRLRHAIGLGDLETLRVVLEEVAGSASRNLLQEARAKRDAMRAKEKKFAKKAARRAEAAGGAQGGAQGVGTGTPPAETTSELTPLPRVPSCPSTAGVLSAWSTPTPPPHPPLPPTVMAADSAASPTAGSADDEDDGCVLCMDARRTHLFVPCGHLCCCERCCTVICSKAAAVGEQPSCPLCRTSSTQAIKLFK